MQTAIALKLLGKVNTNNWIQANLNTYTQGFQDDKMISAEALNGDEYIQSETIARIRSDMNDSRLLLIELAVACKKSEGLTSLASQVPVKFGEMFRIFEMAA